MNISYRLRVYDGLYSSNSTTVLTPASGSAHSDPFAISTIPLTGYEPYMDMPRGKRGSFNVPTQRLEVGTYTINILDKRTELDNANRWVSAFIGNSKGKLNLIGLKTFIEESVDGGNTWSPFFVGQLTDIALESLNKISITIKDNVEYLKENIFQGYPNVDYTIYPTLVPATLSKNVENEQNIIIFNREPGIKVSGIEKEIRIFGQEFAVVRIQNDGLNDPRNIWPLQVGVGRDGPGIRFGYATEGNPIRALVKVIGTEYIFGVEYIDVTSNTTALNQVSRIREIGLYTLPSSEGGVGTIEDLPSGVNLTTVEIYIFEYQRTLEKGAGLFLVNDWKQILIDLLDGKFYAPVTYNGSAIGSERKTEYDEASIDAILVNRTIPRPAFHIEKSISGVEWLEKNLLAPYSVGYTMEPIVSASVPKCRARFFTTAIENTFGSIGTLTETDIVAASPSWDIQPPVYRVAGTFYSELQTRVTKTPSEGAREQVPATNKISEKVVVVDNEFVVDETASVLEFDMNGFRAFAELQNLNTQSTFNITDVQYQRFKVIEHLRFIFDRFKAGTPSIMVKTLRTTNTNALQVGQYVSVDISTIPNQALRARGGTRIMQVLNKFAMGIYYEMELLDSGVNAIMAVPTFGAITNPARGGVQFTATTSADAIVHVQYAVVDISGSAPSVNSPAWVFGARLPINTTTDTILLDGLTEGKIIYIRGRTEAPYNGDIKLPSAWVSVGNITLNNIPTPGAVTASQITTKSAKLTWTNTSTDYAIEIYLASPAGTPDTKIATLPEGSTNFTISGLDLNSSTSHRAGVRYYDPYMGNGFFSTVNFTATGSAVPLDTPAALLLYVARYL